MVKRLGVIRLDPALDALISPGAEIEKLADGFGFTEGPVWVHSGGLPYLNRATPGIRSGSGPVETL